MKWGCLVSFREGGLLFLMWWERKEVLVKIYITVNHLRIFLSSSCHLVIWSLGHSVTWVTQSLCHLVTRSLSNSVTRSFSHLVTQSCGHSIIQSLGHLVTWFLGHSVTQSLSHLVIWSLSHKSLFLYFQHCDWLTNKLTNNIRIYRSASQTKRSRGELG